MPGRKRRTHFYNAAYHVIWRGNNRQKIFFSSKEYEKFITLLKEGIDAFKFKIHCYCLMPNHIHFVIEVADIRLSKIMHNIGYRYAQWFNKKHKRVGHVFQNRYKAILIQSEQYLLELCKYIHLNPVKANMVQDPKKYKWSSHRAFVEYTETDWLTTEYILKILTKNLKEKMSFEAFVLTPKQDLDLKPSMELTPDGKLMSHNSIAVKNSKNMDKEYELRKSLLNINDVFEIVCNELNIDKNELANPGKQHQIAKARTLIAVFIQEFTKTSITRLAKMFNRKPNTICNSITRLNEKLKNNSADKNEIMKIKNKLNKLRGYRKV